MTIFRSPERTLEPGEMATLIGLGGYVHPLFTDPAHLAGTPFTARPVPGQALLLIMGGLAEQTDAYDERTLALLGFDDVTFHRAATDGDRLFVEIEQLPSSPDDGRITRWTWRAIDTDGELLAELTARFLMRR